MFIEAKDDGSGGDNWSYISCKSPVKSSPTTNQHPVFYMLDALRVAQPTVSRQWRENVTLHGLAYPKLTWGLPTLCLTTISSWLPWGRVAMPLISHLMPEPPLPLKCWSLCLRSLLTSLANCLPINWRQHTLTTLDKEPVKQRHISNSNPQRFFSDRALWDQTKLESSSEISAN